MPEHYMQTQPWGEIKSAFGWKVQSLPDGLLVYSRNVPSLGRLNYIPGVSGLTSANAPRFTKELKENVPKGFGVRLEPYQLYDESLIQELEKAGWKKFKRHVQYRHTILIDLTKSEEEILASFKSRARYEIKQAQSFNVQAEEVKSSPENLEIMYGLLKETSKRNKFYIRDRNFTMTYWKKFAEKGMLKLFFAKQDNDILAGAVIVTNKDYAWYKEGGSLREKSNLMAPRLLLWKVMRSLKKAGITTLDLGGIPDPEHHQDSSMHGIYVFKSAFSREHVTLMPTMELPLNAKYKLWPKAEEQWLRVYNLFARNLWY